MIQTGMHARHVEYDRALVERAQRDLVASLTGQPDPAVIAQVSVAWRYQPAPLWGGSSGT